MLIKYSHHRSGADISKLSHSGKGNGIMLKQLHDANNRCLRNTFAGERKRIILREWLLAGCAVISPLSVDDNHVVFNENGMLKCTLVVVMYRS